MNTGSVTRTGNGEFITGCFYQHQFIQGETKMNALTGTVPGTEQTLTPLRQESAR